MTTVLVGPQRQRIRAHETFLCRSSPIFEDAIRGPLAASSSGELCLDTETVATFSTFLTWMYTGHIDGARAPRAIPEPSEGVPGSRRIAQDHPLSPVDLISLYVFGDNWEIPPLRNDVVSFLIDQIESTEEPAWDLLTTRHEHIHLAFDNLPKGSPLLRFLIAEAAWLWDPGLLEQDLDDLPNDFLAGVLNARPRVERRRREGMLGWTPWRDDVCIYHDHGPDEAEKQTCHEKHRDLQRRLKAKIRYGTGR
ncbi:btb poz domain containing protein [Teratosphaeria destructans]|uniref:Btb poz domain containing protein n=1 Tax=Teratosphaeria destructans TaxID=418781 RepID=A0A9W7W235_9PEZI|nr:btb poz domain containing protein [Teratosphaeria destructans]